MKKKLLIVGLLIYSISCFSQVTGTYTDPHDGKVYKTVSIGTQTILAENIAFKPSSGNYWAYKNDQNNISKYGYLYDWATAKTLVSPGWHLPTKQDWKTLLTYFIENKKQVYNELKEGGSSGFNALLGGFRDADGKFSGLGTHAFFWTSSSGGDGQAWSFNCNSEISSALISNNKSACGYSVRLFKD